MRSIASRLKIAPIVMVTFWTILFSLQAGATGLLELSTVNTLSLVFNEQLAADLKGKNALVVIEVEFYDQRWEDADFAPRREALELTRKIGQLNAQYQQAMQSSSSLSMFNQQHPGMPALNETARTARLQAQELESKLVELQSAATVKHRFQLASKELNSGKANIDINQMLATFKRNLVHGIDFKVKVTASNFLFSKDSLVETRHDLLGLLQKMKVDELGQLTIALSREVKLVAFNRDTAGKLYATAK